jgi:hypothetical protein
MKAYTTYYYQFAVCNSNNKSPIGRTKTSPNADDDVTHIGLAVYSCSNYPFGFFNAYGNTVRKVGSCFAQKEIVYPSPNHPCFRTLSIMSSILGTTFTSTRMGTMAGEMLLVASLFPIRRFSVFTITARGWQPIAQTWTWLLIINSSPG